MAHAAAVQARRVQIHFFADADALGPLIRSFERFVLFDHLHGQLLDFRFSSDSCAFRRLSRYSAFQPGILRLAFIIRCLS